jgi:hypothetical protein
MRRFRWKAFTQSLAASTTFRFELNPLVTIILI